MSTAPQKDHYGQSSEAPDWAAAPPPGLPLERHQSGAAASTIEALMFALRRGVDALAEPDTVRRLAELSDEQLLEVGQRLRRLKPEIARAWSADEVAVLMQLREYSK